MKNRVKSFLATLAWLAVLLVAARFLLPWIGFAHAESQLAQLLVRLAPVMVLVFIGSVASLLFISFYQKKLARRYDPRARSIIAEAQQWSDVFVFDEELGETVKLDLSVKADAAQQQQVELSYSGLRSKSSIPHASPNALNDEPQREFVNNTVDQNFGMALEAEIVEDLDATAPRSSVEATPESYDNGLTDVDHHTDYPPEIKYPVKSSLHQLPPPLPEFTGRFLEMSELSAAYASAAIEILGIQGTGGVGKTTLAVKLAHELAPYYPDAQIYIDLKGANALPLLVEEAQAIIIRAYLPTVRLPENETELSRLYRSVLSGKRSLLLFDNAANAQQVIPLLPPDDCLSIVTSRQYIALPRMFECRLDSMGPSDAREMLLRIIPQIGDKAEKVAELCGGLPLALRLAAGAMTEKSPLTALGDLGIEEYLLRLEELQKGAAAMAPIDAVLTASYEALVPGLQKLWRLLAVFPDTFDVNAATSLWKLNPAIAADSLEQLVAHNLVERNRATGRFRLHDLMQRFADLCLSDKERANACLNHSAHYQSVLHESDALYEQGGGFLTEGLNLLDLEWHNIQAGQVWAATHSEYDRAACELCASYPDAGKYVLGLRQHPRERIRWSEAALAGARLLKRRKAEGRHLIALGDSYLDLSEVQHAIECYEKAVELARAIKDSRGEAEALSGLGSAHYFGGGLNRAREYHESALDISRAINDLRVEAIALGNLGITYFALGEAQTATILFDQQLRIAGEIGDRRNENAALGGLATALLSTGNAQRAIELIDQQLAIAREIGDRRGEASALSSLGNAYASLNQHQWAVPFLEQSLAIAREIGDRRNEANALGGLGVAYFLKDDMDVAKQFLEQQLQLAVEIGDRRSESQALTQLGVVSMAKRDLRHAIEVLQQAFNITSQIGDIQGQANSLFKLALALDKFGDRNQAVAQAKTALDLYEAVKHPDSVKVRAQLSEWE